MAAIRLLWWTSNSLVPWLEPDRGSRRRTQEEAGVRTGGRRPHRASCMPFTSPPCSPTCVLSHRPASTTPCRAPVGCQRGDLPTNPVAGPSWRRTPRSSAPWSCPRRSWPAASADRRMTEAREALDWPGPSGLGYHHEEFSAAVDRCLLPGLCRPDERDYSAGVVQSGNLEVHSLCDQQWLRVSHTVHRSLPSAARSSRSPSRVPCWPFPAAWSAARTLVEPTP